MARGSKYAMREAYKYGLQVQDTAIVDDATSTKPIGTIEVSTDGGTAFVVDASNKSQAMKN